MTHPERHPLEEVTVFSPRGNAVSLETLWQTQPVAIVFVRHFGCLLCAEQVAELEAARGRLEATGARLAIVGQGQPEEAARFAEEHKVTLPLFTDPARAAYCAMGFKRGVLSTFNLRAAQSAVEAARKGHRQHKTAGDPFQQGGVVVMLPGGVEAWRFVSRAAGDHPSAAELEQVLASATAPLDSQAA